MMLVHYYYWWLLVTLYFEMDGVTDRLQQLIQNYAILTDNSKHR